MKKDFIEYHKIIYFNDSDEKLSCAGRIVRRMAFTEYAKEMMQHLSDLDNWGMIMDLKEYAVQLRKERQNGDNVAPRKPKAKRSHRAPTQSPPTVET